MSKPRVFITGLSALTASGNTLDQNWDALLQQRSAIAEIHHQDISEWPYRLGGELRDFNAAKMLPDRKLIKVISRQDAMGINAAVQAVEHSEIIGWRESECADTRAFNDTMGVYVGSPGNKYFQQYDFIPLVAKTKANMQDFADQLFEQVHPMWLLRILPNNVLAYVGITYGFKGANHNITNHAVSGMQALMEAYHAIQSGQIERAVVVAYDMGTEAQALFYYGKMGLLSVDGLRPFSHDHNGTVLAEGATALILESEHSVNQRQAKCYGEVLAAGSRTESQGLFSIEKDGSTLGALLSRTLSNHQIKTTEIDCVIAHANANPRSDISEAQALKHSFPAKQPFVSGFKWAMGHTLAASGLLDVVLTCKALQQGILPGLPQFQHAAPDCEHLQLSAQERPLASNARVLIINRGFASINACVVIRGCE